MQTQCTSHSYTAYNFKEEEIVYIPTYYVGTIYSYTRAYIYIITVDGSYIELFLCQWPDRGTLQTIYDSFKNYDNSPLSAAQVHIETGNEIHYSSITDSVSWKDTSWVDVWGHLFELKTLSLRGKAFNKTWGDSWHTHTIHYRHNYT